MLDKSLCLNCPTRKMVEENCFKFAGQHKGAPPDFNEYWEKGTVLCYKEPVDAWGSKHIIKEGRVGSRTTNFPPVQCPFLLEHLMKEQKV